MADLFNTIRTSLKTVADSVAGLQNNVLGNKDFVASTDFFANLVANGASVFIESTSGSVDGQTFNGEFEVDAHLYYAAAQDTDFDFMALDHIIALLVQGWTTHSKFVLGGVQGAFHITWAKPVPRLDLTPNVYETTFKMTFKFVADQLV